MKRTFKTALVLVLALVLTVQTPLQAMAAEAEGPDYISEVKVFMGSSAETELKAEGYTPVTGADGKIVDLNQGAGGGWGSQGDKKVIMGYKTTKRQSEAITDLAVMNMEGGYDVQEYDALMEKYMGAQISPFIDKFLVAINEYRENLGSDDEVNRQRAEYIRAALNKFTDDDCAGAGLGDLLVNETVYERAKQEYDKLPAEEKEKPDAIIKMNNQAKASIPEEEKNQHCDILTLFAQADGQLMLMIYDLIVRGADTSENSWMDRFSSTSYEELLESYDMPEEDAMRQMARDFEDDAKTLIKSWESLRTLLIGTDDAVDAFADTEAPDMDEVEEKVESMEDIDSYLDALEGTLNAEEQKNTMVTLGLSVSLTDYLESIDYGDETMYDFFTQDSNSLDVRDLYPLVASLSEGQRTGLEFISLRELVLLSNRETEYADEELDDLAVTSVYEGVDRAIYEKGGVALTSDTLRSRALDRQKNAADRSLLSNRTVVLWGLTGACAIGFIGSMVGWGIRTSQLSNSVSKLKDLITKDLELSGKVAKYEAQLMDQLKIRTKLVDQLIDQRYGQAQRISNLNLKNQRELVNGLSAQTNTAAWLSAGFAVAMVALYAFTTYMTWQDMKDYYKVDYAVIPHYMVDEASITYYNANGEKLVRENHAAYYKAVTCNRSENDKNHAALTDCADLNGDVGQQWVALYACRDNQVMPPILADSFKVVVGSSSIPAGYTQGIHMFGSDSAFNMNNKLYVWNQSARSVFVYYKVDNTAPLTPRTSGSAFSGGLLALTGVGGLALGALITALSMTTWRKKKQQAA